MAENILHFGAVRLRVTGSGSLRMQLIDLDETGTETLVPLTLASAPGREPTRLCNHKTQRVKLKLFTTAIDEVVRVNRIILYAKELYTSYPG